MRNSCCVLLQPVFFCSVSHLSIFCFGSHSLARANSVFNLMKEFKRVHRKEQLALKNESVLENDPRTPVAARLCSSGPSSADALMLLKRHHRADGMPCLGNSCEAHPFSRNTRESRTFRVSESNGVAERISHRFISQDQIDPTDFVDSHRPCWIDAETQGF
ncbi:hypothetical protein KOR42_24710 [Thalassoglobus neptunius]|uniref:Uncharacterized protein n=1 Tax=Thalassoglobus neptunius TaxID=1938619 RepID=A0A5C5XB16_9PLAN|nr:hypothetical protein KOR42_24710 [Thalassoglobus neptunius]